jgi:N-acetylated-alpha-linked acidic dipeptidase
LSQHRSQFQHFSALLLQHFSALLCLCSLALLTATAQNIASRNVGSKDTSPQNTVTRYVPQSVFGFQNFRQQSTWDKQFLVVPDAKLAGEELKTLTAAPHVASSPEDYATALYVADKFRAAGLQTEIVPYKVLLTFPEKIKVEAFDANGLILSGPTPEHVSSDPYQNDPRLLPGFNASSASGDVTAEVVYANYGRPEDFKVLDSLGISVKGKIVLVRYGHNFRGVKAYIAQQHGAAGVLIYSDPADDGYYLGDIYPKGPYRPATGVQRGSVQYMFLYPGDPETPGIASTPDLPASKRIPVDKITAEPTIPVTPLSYHDAGPILRALGGPVSPHSWQGALPFTYHVGAGPVTAHLVVRLSYNLHTIWDVTGKILGTEYPQDWVLAGNHRDAWTFGAVDPNSGTAAMLEAVHGLGELLQHGWKPKRTIVIASWDAEEQGLIGSTEWAEQHAAELGHAVAYFNTDVGVSGPDFDAASVPSLKPFLRQITEEVPSPRGNTVYAQWELEQERHDGHPNNGYNERHFHGNKRQEVRIFDLGSGSDYTPFIQHLGVPSTDIGSNGPYGVYHSVFDNYAWFTRFADPTFVYEQQQARIFGLEVLHMADADLLPYDYALYGKSITGYLLTAQHKAGHDGLKLDFSAALAAAQQFAQAGTAVAARQQAASGNLQELNGQLRAAEEALLNPAGLPNRLWFKHTIYAPGEYTGYAAVVIPGVNEAIDAGNAELAQQQLGVLAGCLSHAAGILQKAAK